jgi:hypothetical protein
MDDHPEGTKDYHFNRVGKKFFHGFIPSSGTGTAWAIGCRKGDRSDHQATTSVDSSCPRKNGK